MSLTVCSCILKVDDQLASSFSNAELVFESRKTQINSGDAVYVGRPSRSTASPGVKIQDITYISKSVSPTSTISVNYTSGAVAGSEVVTVVGNAITIQIASGVTTAGQIDSLIYDTPAASALVDAVVANGASTTPQTALDLLEYIPYSSSTDITYPGMSRGVSGGSPIVSGGKLDCSALPSSYVDYGSLTGLVGPKGCVRFKVTPLYSGTPVNAQFFLALTTGANVATNLLDVRHNTLGGLHGFIFNAVPVQVVGSDGDVWSPVAGTEYEIEFDWDITNGASRLFVNGVQLGPTDNSTGTRGVPTYLRVGQSNQLTGNQNNFKIRDVQIYGSVQHTSSFTSPVTPVTKTSLTDSYVYLPLAESTTNSQLGTFTLNWNDGNNYGSTIFDPVKIPNQDSLDLSTLLTVARG